ncbi:MAG: hypothetical protein R3C05_16385 [Pirellulaceae bacterium]
MGDKTSLLKISEVVKLLNDSPASRKLLLVDACQEQVLSTQGHARVPNGLNWAAFTRTDIAFPVGCPCCSVAKAVNSVGNMTKSDSVFTYHVIQYLRGDADARFYEAGLIDLAGLNYYVSKRTNDYVLNERLSR